MHSRSLVLVLVLATLAAAPLQAGWKRSLLSGSSSSTRRIARVAAADAPSPDDLAKAALVAGVLALALGDGATCAALSPDGDTLAVGMASGVVHIHDAATGRRQRKLGGHWHAVSSLALDQRRVATGSNYGTARVWARDTGEQVAYFGRTLSMLPWSNAPVGQLALSPDGRWLALSGIRHGVRATDLVKGGGQRVLGSATAPDKAASSPPRAPLVAFVTGSMLAIAEAGAVAPRLVDLAGGSDAVLAPAGASERLVSLAASQDGTLLATGTESGNVIVWEVRTRRERARWRPGPSASDALAFSPKSEFLLAVARDGTLASIPLLGGGQPVSRTFDSGPDFRPLEVRAVARDTLRVLCVSRSRLWLLDTKAPAPLDDP